MHGRVRAGQGNVRLPVDAAGCEMRALQEGFEAGGRARADIQLSLPAFVVTGTTEEEMAAAAKGVREQIAFYGSTPAYRGVLEHHGWGDLQTELNALSKQGEWKQMGTLIDADILGTFAIVAEPDQVGDELLARFGDLVDRISFYAPYQASSGAFAPAIERLRHDLCLELFLKVHLLQAAVFFFELFHARHHGDIHAVALGPPFVKRRCANT